MVFSYMHNPTSATHHVLRDSEMWITCDTEAEARGVISTINELFAELVEALQSRDFELCFQAITMQKNDFKDALETVKNIQDMHKAGDTAQYDATVYDTVTYVLSKDYMHIPSDTQSEKETP